MFDFDRVIERRGTHSSKWDNMARLSGIAAPDAIPMWVADMDFAAPPGVTEVDRPVMSLSTSCACELACASIAVPACWRTCCWVNVVISDAMFTS